MLVGVSRVTSSEVLRIDIAALAVEYPSDLGESVCPSVEDSRPEESDEIISRPRSITRPTDVRR